VAQQVRSPSVVFLGYEIDQRVEIGDRMSHPVDHRAAATRASMTTMIDRVDPVAGGHQLLDHMAIATAVLARPMRDDHGGAALAVSQPCLPVDLEIPDPRELSLDVPHPIALSHMGAASPLHIECQTPSHGLPSGLPSSVRGASKVGLEYFSIFEKND
jgi:hypothetical protein